MDKAKIKNIIILILLAANIFLAAIVITNSAQAGSYKRASEENLRKVLEQSGITLKDWDILKIQAIPSCTFSRDTGAERRRVSHVLGRASGENIGGNIVMYYGKNGQASFRGTGDFEVLMENDSVKAEKSKNAASSAVLKKLGISFIPGSADKENDAAGATSTVTGVCGYKGRPVVNAGITLTYSDNTLLLISGTAPLTYITEGDGEDMLDTATVLMRFAEMLEGSGYVCHSITDISQCYKMDASATGEGTLTPLWHIYTDIGDFYINGITGKTESVTQQDTK